ncbi:MAG: TolB-like translocation protein [Candidatus Dormibacteria bacterium]
MGAYSGRTGRLVRTLAVVGAADPEVVDHGRWVYFITSVSGCEYSIFKVSPTGGRPIAVRTRLEGTPNLGVSLDGKMLAYQTTSGSLAQCVQNGGTGQYLTVTDLQTGITRTVRLPSSTGINSIAWAPNDRSITIATGAGRLAGPLVLSMADVMTGEQWTAKSFSSCPRQATCFVLAVGYADNGQLYFLANDSEGSHGRYRLMARAPNGDEHQLAAWVGRASSGGTVTIDPAGTTALVVIPRRGDGWQAIRWSKYLTTRLPTQLYSVSWS